MCLCTFSVSSLIYTISYSCRNLITSELYGKIVSLERNNDSLEIVHGQTWYHPSITRKKTHKSAVEKKNLFLQKNGCQIRQRWKKNEEDCHHGCSLWQGSPTIARWKRDEEEEKGWKRVKKGWRGLPPWLQSWAGPAHPRESSRRPFASGPRPGIGSPRRGPGKGRRGKIFAKKLSQETSQRENRDKSQNTWRLQRTSHL